MASYVTLANEAEHRVASVKVGFSWICLFWTWLFAIPLFIKRVYPWALGILAIQVVSYVIEQKFLFYGVEHTFRCLTRTGDSCSIGWSLYGLYSRWSGLITLAFSIYLGFQGNEIIARYYLKNGYRFAEPESPIVKQAQIQWRMQI